MEGSFGFENLSRHEAVERKSARLSKLEPNFFPELRRYLEILEVTYRQEYEKNPAGKRVQFLGDELRNARRKADALWEARERKIVQTALKNAHTGEAGSAPPEHLSKEEESFYDALLVSFRDQQLRMLPSGPAEGALPARPMVAAIAASTGPNPSPTTTVTTTTPSSPALAPTPTTGVDDLQTVRALVDIPPFIGYDGKTYRIKKGELLTLPRRFAKILKERGQIALVT